MKLNFEGKILTDDGATVESCNIQEKDFLVVMVTKVSERLVFHLSSQPKAAPAPEVKASAGGSSNVKEAVEPLGNSAATPPAPTPPAPSTSQTEAPSTGAVSNQPQTNTDTTFDASTLATGAQLQAAMKNLIEMGFTQEEVTKAMRAAFNNPDRAAEYLVNVDAAVTTEAASPPAPMTAPTQNTNSNPAGGSAYINLFDAAAAAAATQQSGNRQGAGAESLSRLLEMRNSPQFQEFRNLIRSQPQLLQPLLQQLGQTQPELLQAITQNQEAFMQMLMDGGSEGAAEDAGAEGAAGTQYITVTPEEEAAINRLTALGFDRMAAAEAFFACDKNEELAANFLFDSMNQEE
ncbi:hypothetical protein HDU96_010752 [Phlyctochytrium bullatum]|nr:hypothetical protein HDU96_010752 [Phlyctochytrium bullatum]